MQETKLIKYARSVPKVMHPIYLYRNYNVCWNYRIRLCREGKTTHHKERPNNNSKPSDWFWDSSSGALENVQYLFIAITPKSTLTQSCRNLLEYHVWVK